LAAAGILPNVFAVYSDNVLMATPGDYVIVFAGGRTYINFAGDQGDNIISFNTWGYGYVAWDGTEAFVQNPAYVLLYFLRFIMDIPFAALDVVSFDDLATIYDNMVVSGKLILQKREDAIEIFRQLLFTFGAKAFVTKEGRIKVGRKDISSYSADTFLFDQNDLLSSGERDWNLTKTMNVDNARYDYIPWLRLFKSAVTDSRSTFDEDYEDDVTLPKEYLPQ
jgi:hypothetical protein